jgi:uncharacterized protein YbaA (DUF1428 family)
MQWQRSSLKNEELYQRPPNPNPSTTMNTSTDSYVDGFVIPIAKAKLEAYTKMAGSAAIVWKEHGALDYKECVLEDPRIEGTQSFLDLTGVSDAETVIFSVITYRSRAHRDEVNAKVMADPRIQEFCPANNSEQDMPFDPARMNYGGFQTIVS